ncbi:MAG: 3-phosphoshikimate 1-carboxyvinyltransferase [Spirochaetes bacterium]|nr:3-phosphoshikimate 1-carboxyvinyltransferase [Spirochaetota bacterium]
MQQTIKIEPKGLKGQVAAPPSKSDSHRAILCTGLSATETEIEHIVLSEDVKATMGALKTMGVAVEEKISEGQHVTLKIRNPWIKAYYTSGKRLDHGPLKIDCRESGSTARFMMPLFHLSEAPVTFYGAPALSRRPYTPYYDLFKAQSETIKFTTDSGHLPLTVSGTLTAGVYPIVGNVSSQFISGLLMSLPLLDGDSEIIVTPPLESKAYIDMTLSCLSAFHIKVETPDELHYKIKGNQKYSGSHYLVEGDYSAAAFWLVAAALGNEVAVSGLSQTSKQADQDILNFFEGAYRWKEDVVWVEANDANQCTFDVSQCPDLVPILAVYCALSKGTSRIVNAARLRIKESDRLKAITTELNKMGADIEELEDALIIHGVTAFKGAQVDAWNDHRIAMALAIAATRANGPVVIKGAASVSKSYPDFWNDYIKLGGELSVQ